MPYGRHETNLIANGRADIRVGRWYFGIDFVVEKTEKKDWNGSGGQQRMKHLSMFRDRNGFRFMELQMYLVIHVE